MVATGLFTDGTAVFLLFTISEGAMLNFAGPTLNQFALMGGFFIKTSLLPSFLQWVPKISPLRAAFGISMSALYSGRTIGCGDIEPTRQTVPCPLDGNVALKALDIGTDSLPEDVLLLLLWIFGLRIASFCIYKLKMLRGNSDKIGQISLSYRATGWVLNGMMRVYYREHTLVGENRLSALRPNDGVIFVMNHSNLFLDSGVLGPALLKCKPRRPVSFLVAQVSYEHGMLGCLARRSGAIPVRRAQDVATQGVGRIVSISVDGNGSWIIHGEETTFSLILTMAVAW
jgi:hypothetical protein